MKFFSCGFNIRQHPWRGVGRGGKGELRRKNGPSIFRTLKTRALKTQSRFLIYTLDGVVGPLRLAGHTGVAASL